MQELENILRRLNGAIEQMEADDTAYLPYYTVLIKERAIIKRALKHFKRLENKR